MINLSALYIIGAEKSGVSCGKVFGDSHGFTNDTFLHFKDGPFSEDILSSPVLIVLGLFIKDLRSEFLASNLGNDFATQFIRIVGVSGEKFLKFQVLENFGVSLTMVIVVKFNYKN